MRAGVAGKTAALLPIRSRVAPLNFSLIRVLFIVSLLATNVASGIAQTLQRIFPEFIENGRTLPFPLAGGLNSPQFSAVDLNQDGLPDLHVFDRVGNKHLTFLNTGQAGETSYTFAPEYAVAFPDITNWMLLRDYNGDGVMDIFAYGDQNFDAVMVFTGFYENGHIAFRRFSFNAPRNVIYVPRPTGGSTQLYVSMVDYPAVDDVDCDGDLDVLTFNLVGGYVEFYLNQSVERGFGRDSLLYRLQENCWGGFFESGISNEVELAAAPGDCVDKLLAGDLEVRHSGSTLLTFDADGDQDRELILGDISFNNINFLHNGGDCTEAWMNDQDFHFPSYDVPANVPVFPATFLVDVDNDGLRDLLVAPNVSLGGADRMVWRYKNVGTGSAYSFDLRQNDFLVGDMIDLGSGARPVFVDYDADGLQDLIIGNYSFYQEDGLKNARLFLYRNTGSASQPRFELIDDDYLSLNQFSQNAYAFTPTFGDLDGDGDLDALVGEQNGRLFFAENTAGPHAAFSFLPAQYGYMDINVGQASVPQIIDLDEDNLPDLVIGERNGNINYFQNQGDSAHPSFSSEPTEMVLGGVDARVPGYTTGYSSPLFFEEEGRRLLLTATEVGRLEIYDQIEGNLDGSFGLVTETYGQLREGIRTHAALADIDNDGLLELAVGNFSGGISLFKTDFKAGLPVPTGEAPVEDNRVAIWPNPATDHIRVRLREPLTDGVLTVLNAAGQVLMQQDWQGREAMLPVDQWPAGLYWLQINSKTASWSRRFVIQ